MMDEPREFEAILDSIIARMLNGKVTFDSTTCTVRTRLQVHGRCCILADASARERIEVTMLKCQPLERNKQNEIQNRKDIHAKRAMGQSTPRVMQNKTLQS